MKNTLIFTLLLLCPVVTLGQPQCDQTLSPGAGIQAAVNAAANNSTICLNKGTYTGGIVIGNGTTTSLSTKYGIQIIGLAPPTSGNYNGEFTSPTIIDCTGLTSGACVAFNGKLTGGGLSNVTLIGDPTKLNVKGINIVSARELQFHHVAVKNFGDWHLNSESLVSCTGGCATVTNNAEPTSNRFNYFIMEFSSLHPGKGIALGVTGGTDPSSMYYFNHFGAAVYVPNSVIVEMGSANDNTFVHSEFAVNHGVSGTTHWRFNYTRVPHFPSGNNIIAWGVGDFGSTNWDAIIQNVGTPNAASQSNYFTGIRVNPTAAAGLLSNRCPHLPNMLISECPRENKGPNPLMLLNQIDAAQFSSYAFLENSNTKAVIQRLGSSYPDAARRKAVEFVTFDQGPLDFFDVASRRVRLEATGNINIYTAGKGVVLKSPDGATCRQIGIDNSGALVATVVGCP